MPIPTSFTDLSSSDALNGPAGTDSPAVLDDYIRSVQGILSRCMRKGSDIPSSTTITIPVEGSFFNITGTTTIASINACYDGRTVAIRFGGALTLTHSSSLSLPGSANITTATDDFAVFVNTSGSNWKCIYYSGLVVLASAFTSFSSGFSRDFSGSVKEIKLLGDVYIQSGVTAAADGTIKTQTFKTSYASAPVVVGSTGAGNSTISSFQVHVISTSNFTWSVNLSSNSFGSGVTGKWIAIGV